jgi:predicted NAD-dependent protein-ADP-ribosyltransferase YbiA (DUF1768 family)
MLLSAPGMDLGPQPQHTVLSTAEEPLSSGFEALFGLDGVLCDRVDFQMIVCTHIYEARRCFRAHVLPLWPCAFLQTARRYKTVTHCLAARCHAANPDLASQIRRAETPAQAAELAGAAPGEQDDATRIAECRAATLAKCQQNKHISARLLATGSAPIVVVGDDPFWEAAESTSSSGNALGRVLMDVRLELQDQAALEERRAGSVAHTIGAGLVALGLGIATAGGPPTDDEGVVIPADGDDTAATALQAEIEVARLTRIEEDWATGVLTDVAEDASERKRDELHQHLRPAEAASPGASTPAGWRSVIAQDFQWIDTTGQVATGPTEAAARFATQWRSKHPDAWALRAREISSRRFGLVCYERWEYCGEGAMDAAERDDVALLDPSLFGGASDSSSSDDDCTEQDVTTNSASVPEPQQEQRPVDWPDGTKVITRVTAVLRIAPPGPADDFGGLEWVHRHETKLTVVGRSTEMDSDSQAAAARAERLQRQQEECSIEGQ